MVTFDILPAESMFVPRLVLPKRDTPPLKENSATCAEARPAPAKKTATAAHRCIQILLYPTVSGYFKFVAAGGRAKVNQLAIDRLLYRGTCGDERSTDGVLFQFAAGRVVLGLAGRTLSRRIPGLRKKTRNRGDDITNDREDGQQDDEAKKKAKHRLRQAITPVRYLKTGCDQKKAVRVGGSADPDPYFFLPFFVSLAAAFSYFVVSVLSIVVSAPLAESANGPLGFSAKYFSRASFVPSAGVTLPSGVICGFPSRDMPY